jgi:hypothetical protein
VAQLSLLSAARQPVTAAKNILFRNNIVLSQQVMEIVEENDSVEKFQKAMIEQYDLVKEWRVTAAANGAVFSDKLFIPFREKVILFLASRLTQE